MLEDINIAIVGHVDHGKSTIIGRLLADTKSLPKGKIEFVKNNCKMKSRKFEYAYLLDALKEEQAQGITIDTARCFFKTSKKNCLITDVPGHLEFLKNMITGISNVDAAFIVIDVSEGIKENTKRHGYLLKMLGINQVVVLINKMDLINFSKSKYEKVKEEYEEYMANIGLKPLEYIPVSGETGDNIKYRTDNIKWYIGSTVLEMIDKFKPYKYFENKDFRMTVQDVYKFTKDNDNRRIIAGTVESGKATIGCDVTFYPSRKKSIIKSLEAFEEEVNTLTMGYSAGITIKDELYIKRGEIICLSSQSPPKVSKRIYAKIFWLGKDPLITNKKYLFKIGHSKRNCVIKEIKNVIDVLEFKSNTKNLNLIEKNCIGECIIELEDDIAFDTEIFETSRFAIIDNYEIAGGGIILEDLNDFQVKKETAFTKHKNGIVIWLTGNSGAGKTTISKEVERKIEVNSLVYRMDADDVRKRLNKDLGFSESDRLENIRRIAEVSKMFAEAGVVVIVSTISPLVEMRKLARQIIPNNQLIEFYIQASLDTCKKRDPKGLYKSLFNETNYIEYVEENDSNVINIINTEELSIQQSSDMIIDKIKRRKINAE